MHMVRKKPQNGWYMYVLKVGRKLTSFGGLFDRRADFIRIATNAGTVFESIERWGSGAALHEVRYGVGQRKLLHGPGVGILRPYGKTL